MLSARALRLFAFGLVLTLCGIAPLHAQPGNFEQMKKAKMRWNLSYKFEPGQVFQYELDTISQQEDSGFSVATAGSEWRELTQTTTRVYLTVKVLDFDEQGNTTLEFTYDNAVSKISVNEGEEQLLDTSGLVGRRFVAILGPKGVVSEIEGSGNAGDFLSVVEGLFILLPDQTLKIGDSWEDRKELHTTDPETGLEIHMVTGIEYRILDFEEDRRRKRDIVVLNVSKTIDQELSIQAGNQDGGTVVETKGQGSGKGTVRGEIRIDPRTGQLVQLQIESDLNNNLTVDEHQLVGQPTRNKYRTSLSSTSTTVLKDQ